MPPLSLSAQEALTTTRAVRKWLDFDRPVERAVIEECLEVALQAPTGSNLQNWQFLVITDAAQRSAIGGLYRQGWEIYKQMPGSALDVQFPDEKRQSGQERVIASAQYLVDHIHEVPVLVIPCISARTDAVPIILQSAIWGSIIPAAWSFMLAARDRGLGTSFTSLHLFFEEQAAQILGIPFGEVMQAGLIPTGYATRTNFRAAPREPLSSVLHWDRW